MTRQAAAEKHQAGDPARRRITAEGLILCRIGGDGGRRFMKPSRHLVGSIGVSLALAPWLSWRSLLVLAGGILPDLDRYVWYVLRHKSWEVRSAMSRFQGRERLRGGPRFLHSLEFLIVLIGTGFVWKIVWLFALGTAFHLALDLLIHKKHGRFRLYPDWSHFHCLVLEWIRAKHAETADARPDRTDGPSEDDE